MVAPLLLTLTATTVANVPLDLVMLSDEQGVNVGAVCLDGTNPGFYMAKGNGTGADKWVLYFKGGGWCYDEASCLKRAKTSIGSSKYFTKTFEFSGMMDSDPIINPTFHNFNRVVLWYCDGASFSGNAAKPYISPNGDKLWFRGKRVLDAMLEALMKDHGLGTAKEVLLSGGSAGGLAAYLHTDYVAAKMPRSVRKFKSSPVSGFFLMHHDYTGAPGYIAEMKYVFGMQNSTGGVNQDCINARAPGDRWRCIFANESYAYTKSPIFPLNSAIDKWQMGSIWKGDGSCTRDDFKNCTAAEVTSLNVWEADFLRDLTTPATARRAGNGAFVESCLEHCGEQTGEFYDNVKLKSRGGSGATMREAHAAWWLADVTQSAAEHTYLPGCRLNIAAPHQCNPSCSVSGGFARDLSDELQ